MRKLLLSSVLSVIVISFSSAQALPLREQAGLIDQILSERLNQLLPALMERSGIDCWVVMSREYNEDPVLRTLLPAEWLYARRRTIFVFFHTGKGLPMEKLAISRYVVSPDIQSVWDFAKFPDQWDALADLLKSHQPRRIGLNISTDFGHADGMDHSDYMTFMGRVPAELRERVVSAESLAIGWLETRSLHEMALYPQLVGYTHRVIAVAFSGKVIQPGVTRTEDVEWWLRQRIRDDGYDTWFHPTVDIQRADSGDRSSVIRPGDLLHVDFGISYLRLNTDVQEHAYVLRAGETGLPVGLVEAFSRGHRLQDILTGQFAEGRTGNQMLAAALAEAKREGIGALVYTHPIGYHGHAAGPVIGLWDQQGGVKGGGDYALHSRTAFSIELSAVSVVAGWVKPVRIMLEEDGYYDERGFRYIGGRQERVYLLQRQEADDDPAIIY